MNRRHLRRATPNTTWTRRIATGGRPVEAVCEALAELPARGGEIWPTTVCHDETCPCLRGESLERCNCEVLDLVVSGMR
jgi:hypothetical protein